MKYDTEEIKPTKRFIKAIEELLRAEIEMMRLHDIDKYDQDCWAWGICTVRDLAAVRGLEFEFGGEEDKPKGFPKDTDVWVKYTRERK